MSELGKGGSSRSCWQAASLLSLNRPPDRTWRRPPGRPRNKCLDQLRNDSTRPTGDLWRRAVDRGCGGATTLRLHDHDDDDDDEASYFGSGARPKDRRRRPKGPRVRMGFVGRGQPTGQPIPTMQLRGLGSAVSSLSGVRDEAPAGAKRVPCVLEAPDGLSWNWLRTKFGGAWPLSSPLKSALTASQ